MGLELSDEHEGEAMIFRYYFQVLLRVILFIITPIILFIPTLYATARNLDRLPWGLNGLFGCEEDGWNGKGGDPNNPRQGWQEGKWGVWVEEENRDPNKKYQGWWPDYKKVKWSELSFIKRWWLGYVWCGWRNVAWNLRLTSFSANTDYREIEEVNIITEGKEVYATWSHNGKEYFFKRQYIFGKLWEWGWEFSPKIFDESDPLYHRIRNHGYTRGFKYRNRGIVSIRPRREVKKK